MTKSMIPISPFSSKKQELLDTILKMKGILTAQVATIPRSDRSRPLPLSYAQQRLWFLDQLEPASPAYNIPAVIRLSGPLDIPCLERSFNRVISRHEILRTVFSLRDGEPVQVVRPHQPISIEVIDLTGLEQESRQEAAMREAGQEASRGFDLSQGPMLRVKAVKVDEQEHVMVMTMHHIVSDAWSMRVLVKEVTEGYDRELRGDRDEGEELEIQYGDYAAWERGWLKGEAMREQEEYWREKLEGVKEVRLGGSREEEKKRGSRRGGHERVEIGAGVSERLKEVSRKEGVTLFMTMLAAFQTLLYHYTDQPDIVVGTDEANRNRREVEGLIGFFINTLVMRTDLSGNPSFKELLKRVKEVVLGAFSNKDLPFDYLVKVLKVKREAGVNPIFQIGFGLQNQKTLMPALSLAGLTLSSVEFGEESLADDTAIFDISLNIFEREKDMVASFRYDRDLFKASTMARMAAHYHIILESISAQPDIRVDGLRATLAEWDSQQRSRDRQEFQQARRDRLRNARPKTL